MLCIVVSVVVSDKTIFVVNNVFRNMNIFVAVKILIHAEFMQPLA